MAATEEKTGLFAVLTKKEKVILVASLVIVSALLLLPDIYLKKYVPWVK
jgi:hypothetical protein